MTTNPTVSNVEDKLKMAPIKDELKDSKVETGTESRYSSTTSGVEVERSRATMSSRVSHSHGYNYSGESPHIDLILGLPSEKFVNKVVFSTFVDKIKNHILTHFTLGKDLMPILEYMKDPTSSIEDDEPKDLSVDDLKSEVKRWMKQEEVKLHIKRLKALENNQEKLYAIMWGQLTHGLQEIIKGDDDFVYKDTTFDSIWLLQKAKLTSSGVDSKANKHLTFVQALTSFCTIQQGQSESNDSFRQRIDAAALTLGLAGGSTVLCSPGLLISKDENNPSEKEIQVEIEKVKAMVMFLRSDVNRYGTLQDDLSLSVYKGRDEFPVTITATYDLLQHTAGALKIKQSFGNRLNRFRFRKNNQRSVTFLQTNNPNVSEAVPGNDGKLYTHITCHNCNTPGHYSNQCPSNKKHKVTLAHFSLTQQKLELIDKNWILLDTCSTVSVFCNKYLIKDVRDCLPGQGITVVTNGGSETFVQQGTMKLLPLEVHFNPSYIANIISLSDVANLKGARVTMDSSVARVINLHFNGDIYQFKECADGLYYFDPTKSNHSNVMPVTPYPSLVQTVAQNKLPYSKNDVKGADRARALQQQLGWPSQNAFLNIIKENHIHNSPVTTQDIIRAQQIYGTPAPLIKGTMVRTKPTAVRVNTKPLPQQILSKHPSLQLYIDFFYVNKIPFLHTKCSIFGYLTAHGGVGRGLTSIKNIMDKVINLYEARGFHIADIHGDNEFDVPSLHDYLAPIIIHIYGRGEHVANIERSNRTVKQKCRTICHALPYRRYTKLMTIMLVDFVLFWLNAIPSHNDNTITHISPSNIVKGSPKPDFKYKHLAFGTYCLVYVTTNNNMKARSVTAISLSPSNQWGGHYFMSLTSGKKIHGFKWVELPISNEVVDRVHELANKEEQPELVNGDIIFEWGLQNDLINETTDVTSIHEGDFPPIKMNPFLMLKILK